VVQPALAALVRLVRDEAARAGRAGHGRELGGGGGRAAARRRGGRREVAVDHVRHERPRRADKADDGHGLAHRAAAGAHVVEQARRQRRGRQPVRVAGVAVAVGARAVKGRARRRRRQPPRQRDGVEQPAKVSAHVGRPVQGVEVGRPRQQPCKLRPGRKRHRQAHGRRHNQNVGKNDHGVQLRKPAQRLQRHLGRQRRRVHARQEAVAAQRLELGQVTPRLAHRPYGRRPARRCAARHREESVVRHRRARVAPAPPRGRRRGRHREVKRTLARYSGKG
jgi:hypothetical protein